MLLVMNIKFLCYINLILIIIMFLKRNPDSIFIASLILTELKFYIIALYAYVTSKMF